MTTGRAAAHLELGLGNRVSQSEESDKWSVMSIVGGIIPRCFRELRSLSAFEFENLTLVNDKTRFARGCGNAPRKFRVNDQKIGLAGCLLINNLAGDNARLGVFAVATQVRGRNHRNLLDKPPDGPMCVSKNAFDPSRLRVVNEATNLDVHPKHTALSSQNNQVNWAFSIVKLDCLLGLLT